MWCVLVKKAVRLTSALLYCSVDTFFIWEKILISLEKLKEHAHALRFEVHMCSPRLIARLWDWASISGLLCHIYASQELTSLHKIPELRWMLSSEPSAGFPWWRARESSEEDPFWLIGSLLPFHLQNIQGNSNFFSIKQLASRWNKAGRCYSPD